MQLVCLAVPLGLVLLFLWLSRRSSTACPSVIASAPEPKKKTIATLTREGINSLDELRLALQYAIQLEFSTIPPYLTAEWSIKDQKQQARTIIHEIVIQEMVHMGLACNMLSAIGGKARLTQAGFVPSYPCTGLPGGVHPDLKVSLLPLSAEALKIFMEIEMPQHGPIAAASGVNIGDFYDAIADGFKRLSPTFGGGFQLEHSFAVGELFRINNLEDALKAIRTIKDQGEGSQQTPMPEDSPSGEPSHYYAFKQLLVGKRLRKADDGSWHFDGEDMPLPAVHSFGVGSVPETADFNSTLTALLKALEDVWGNGAPFHQAMQAMMRMRKQGIGLMERGILPDFHPQ